MEKLKVMTILVTRPESIRLSEVIKACYRYFRHVLEMCIRDRHLDLNVHETPAGE